ncbi:MAG: hypothetical protein GTN73_00060 [Candidatus Aminicenantes bacterium]|nr:hypothetical protein [Candidatus Aminicenantes bacterium]
MKRSVSLLPKWIGSKMSRESISSSLTEKKLKELRDARLVKFRPVSFLQQGERKGQPTKWEYYTADLLAYLDSNSVEKETDKGGATMSKNGWSEPDKFGRSRYQLAKGFQIIERNVVGRKS